MMPKNYTSHVVDMICFASYIKAAASGMKLLKSHKSSIESI